MDNQLAPFQPPSEQLDNFWLDGDEPSSEGVAQVLSLENEDSTFTSLRSLQPVEVVGGHDDNQTDAEAAAAFDEMIFKSSGKTTEDFFADFNEEVALQVALEISDGHDVADDGHDRELLLGFLMYLVKVALEVTSDVVSYHFEELADAEEKCKVDWFWNAMSNRDNFRSEYTNALLRACTNELPDHNCVVIDAARTVRGNHWVVFQAAPLVIDCHQGQRFEYNYVVYASLRGKPFDLINRGGRGFHRWTYFEGTRAMQKQNYRSGSHIAASEFNWGTYVRSDSDFTKCMTIVGSNVQMITCPGFGSTRSNLWFYDSATKQIYHYGHGSCLTYDWSNNNVVMHPCGDYVNQRWTYDSVSRQVKTEWSGAENLCLDYDTITNIYMYPCHAGKNQKFDFAADFWKVTCSYSTSTPPNFYGPFSKIGGSYTQLSVDNSQRLWAVDDSPYTGQANVDYRSGSSTVSAGGWLRQISVSGDGNHIWGVNGYGNVFYRNGIGGGWEGVGGILDNLSVNYWGTKIWGTSPDGSVFYREGRNGQWQHISGKLIKQIAVSGNGAHVWAVDFDGAVWYRSVGSGAWVSKSGWLENIAVTFDGSMVWGTNPDGGVFYSATDPQFANWFQVPGVLFKYVALSGTSGSTNIVVVGADACDGSIWHSTFKSLG
jgi:hypothetical protein